MMFERRLSSTKRWVSGYTNLDFCLPLAMRSVWCTCYEYIWSCSALPPICLSRWICAIYVFSSGGPHGRTDGEGHFGDYEWHGRQSPEKYFSQVGRNSAQQKLKNDFSEWTESLVTISLSKKVGRAARTRLSGRKWRDNDHCSRDVFRGLSLWPEIAPPCKFQRDWAWEEMLINML